MSQTTNEIRIDTVNRNSRMEMQNLDNITIEKEKNITPNTATLDTRKSNNEMKKDVNINQNITIEKNNHNNTSDDKQPAQYDDKMLTMLLEALKNHQNQNQNELSREVLVKILTDVITKQNSQKQNSVSPKIKVSPKISGGKNTFNNNKNSTERKTKSKKKKNKKKKDANVNQKTSGKISTSSQTTNLHQILTHRKTVSKKSKDILNIHTTHHQCQDIIKNNITHQKTNHNLIRHIYAIVLFIMKSICHDKLMPHNICLTMPIIMKNTYLNKLLLREIPNNMISYGLNRQNNNFLIVIMLVIA